MLEGNVLGPRYKYHEIMLFFHSGILQPWKFHYIGAQSFNMHIKFHIVV